MAAGAELEVAGHIAATVRKQKMVNASAQPAFSLFSQHPYKGHGNTCRVTHPTSVNLIKIIPYRHCQQPVDSR